MTNRIFKAVESFAELEARVLAELATLDERKARVRAKPEVYRNLYDDALRGLQQYDMLPLDKAAGRMRLTPAALLRKADRGQVVLIDIEGLQLVPAWTLDKAGRVKPFHLAIAREFTESGQQEWFKFMSYVNFMGGEKLKFVVGLSPRSLKEAFNTVGVTKGEGVAIIKTPMFEAADRALKNKGVMQAFVERLGSALTRTGGMGNPNEGGLSEAFLAQFVPADIPHRERWKREI